MSDTSTPAAPPLSVVMPTLNQAAYIRQAVASVMSQGIPGLELLVQDGGSSDGTLDILAELSALHPGLRWVSEPDSGPADALNRAFARAQGQIIGWLNSDDLYTPGAAARALAVLQRQPGQVMVYGNAEHIDETGAVLGRYPSRDPATALATAGDGCHICQPTVFFRRELLQALGGLDTGLRTAFDFDFWLRLLKAYPGRVSCMPEVQAHSRLHAGAITLRLREQVALEGMQVIHRHLGPAPAHWLLTHVDELMARWPAPDATEAPAEHLHRLVNRAAAWMSADGCAELRERLAHHRAVQLGRADFGASVHADGWAPATLSLRLRQAEPPYIGVRIGGRHASPLGGVLQLQISPAGVPWQRVEVAGPGPFQLTLPIEERRPGAEILLQVRCLNAFVPADSEPGSTDRRPLAFMVESLEPLRKP